MSLLISQHPEKQPFSYLPGYKLSLFKEENIYQHKQSIDPFFLTSLGEKQLSAISRFAKDVNITRVVMN